MSDSEVACTESGILKATTFRQLPLEEWLSSSASKKEKSPYVWNDRLALGNYRGPAAPRQRGISSDSPCPGRFFLSFPVVSLGGMDPQRSVYGPCRRLSRLSMSFFPPRCRPGALSQGASSGRSCHFCPSFLHGLFPCDTPAADHLPFPHGGNYSAHSGCPQARPALAGDCRCRGCGRPRLGSRFPFLVQHKGICHRNV